ncbi:MAG: VOC family protein [Deltaproteobacteria bacterium]|nr:VOC family protein [Deltaproteobacteria bacterium]
MTDLKTVTVATSDLDAAVGAFRASFGLPLARSAQDAAAETRSAFLGIGVAEIEMTSPSAADAPLARVLAERGGGLHQLVLEVDDLDRARDALAARGIELSLGLRPDGRRGGWLDPGRTHGVPIVLVGR